MVSLAQCQRILADHPRIHPHSLAGKEYQKLGGGSLAFLQLDVKDDPVKGMWEYQAGQGVRMPSKVPAPPTITVSVDRSSLTPEGHGTDDNILQNKPPPDSQAALHSPKGVQNVAAFKSDVESEERISAQIHALGLQGLNALVYIFLARHGGLDACFDYMDANNSGQVSLNAWSTCLLVMHLQVEKLVGLTPSEIFAMIDTHNSNTISKDEFLSFFKKVQQEGSKVPSVRAAPVAVPDLNLKRIESEEAHLLAALGSLDEKLGGKPSQQGGAQPAARQGRPPRPKPLKLSKLRQG